MRSNEHPKRYCGNCGAEIRSGTTFCVSCGKPVGRGPASPGPDNPVPPPPTPSRSLADTLQEAFSGITERFSNASSSSFGSTAQGVLNGITKWFRDLPLTPKLILVVLALLLLLTVLSPLAFVVSALLLVVSAIVLLMRVRDHGAVRGWGIIAATSIALMVVFGAMSNALYGIGSDPEQELYGEWSGVVDGETLSFTFISGGTVLASDGIDSESGTYEVDMSEDPAHLDIAWDNDREVKTIVELIDDDHIRFEANEPGLKRPTSFDDSLVLTRGENSRSGAEGNL